MLVSDQNPIVQVRPYKDSFVVHWLMTKRCYFDCSYCPDIYHSRNAADHNLDQLKQAWNKIAASTKHKESVKFSVSLLGGEPTLNPDFVAFCRWLRYESESHIVELGVITNGTASESVYKNLVSVCDWLTFSTHSEFMSERKFFRNVLQAHRTAQTTCTVTVNIMDEPWHKERNKVYRQFLDRHGIRSYLHPILEFNESKDPYPVRQAQQIKFYDSIDQRSEL
jgi:MoaA/NifB/PqqE/SkfB family radical SAM enzyme